MEPIPFKEFIQSVVFDFFVAFGVIVGGAIIGGIGAFLVSKPPLTAMWTLAGNLKIWAVVAAIGGTFDTITNLEKGFLYGSPDEIVKQIIVIVSAMTGAHSGTILIQWLTQQEYIG
ncbi:MAG TPA: YtrH family sporulation protein [Bacillales bacterium]|nr:YtrH family sporulation protein [Bacillales bacterium]